MKCEYGVIIDLAHYRKRLWRAHKQDVLEKGLFNMSHQTRQDDEKSLRQREEDALRKAPFCLYRETDNGVLEFKHDQFKWLRVAVPCVLLAGAFVSYFWQNIISLTLMWWIMPAWLVLGYGTFAIMLPITSVEEVYIHMCPMHRRFRFRVLRWLFDLAYLAHDQEHHARTLPRTQSGRDSFPIRRWCQVMHSTFPGYILGVFWPLHLIPAWLIFVVWTGWGVWGWVIVLGIIAGITARFARYEPVHSRQHEPNERRLLHYTNDERGRMTVIEDNHHRLHHHRPLLNMNVPMWRFMGIRFGFIGDIMAGTYIKVPDTPQNDEEIEELLKGIPHDYINPRAPLAWLTRALRWLFVADDHPMFAK